MLERWIALAAAAGLLLSSAATAALARRRGDGSVTPLSLFQLVWAVALGLFAIPWVRYTATSIQAWIAIYGSILTFSVGAFAAQTVRRWRTQTDPGQRETPDPQRLCRTWALFGALGLVGFAAFVHAVDAVLGWQAVFNQPSLVRGIQSTSTDYTRVYGPWKLLTYFNQVAFLLWTIGVRERAFSRRWRPAYVLGAVSLLPFVFTGDRTLMLTSLIWAALFHAIYKKPVSLRKLVVLGAVTVVGCAVAFGMLGARVDKSIESHPEIAASLTSTTLDQLVLPYVYVTGNPPTLSGLMDDPIRPHTGGRLTILPAVKVLHGLGLAGQPPEVVGAFYSIPFETFNNYSWLGTLYLDFGWVGVLLVPLFFGYVCTAVFVRARRRLTMLGCWTASLLLYCIAFTPMLPKFSDTLTWQYLLLGPVVVRLIRPGPSFAELRRRAWLRVRSHPRSSLTAALAGVAVGAAGVASVSAATTPAGLPPTREAFVDKLQRSARLGERTRRDDGTFPSPGALASRLHARDPAVTYVALEAMDILPADPRTVGVYTTGGRFGLSARVDRRVAVLVSRTSESKASTTFRAVGEAPLNRQLVANGGFGDELVGWQISGGGVALFTVTPLGHRGLGIAVGGPGGPGEPVEMHQTLPITAPAKACFTFGAWVRPSDLNRSLRTWMRFVYADGSFDDHVLGRAGIGIGPGTDRWRRMQVSGRTRKPLVLLLAYVADTRAKPLSGTAFLDDIQVIRTC